MTLEISGDEHYVKVIVYDTRNEIGIDVVRAFKRQFLNFI